VPASQGSKAPTRSSAEAPAKSATGRRAEARWGASRGEGEHEGEGHEVVAVGEEHVGEARVVADGHRRGRGEGDDGDAWPGAATRRDEGREGHRRQAEGQGRPQELGRQQRDQQREEPAVAVHPGLDDEVAEVGEEMGDAEEEGAPEEEPRGDGEGEAEGAQHAQHAVGGDAEASVAEQGSAPPPGRPEERRPAAVEVEQPSFDREVEQDRAHRSRRRRA
jgi:hypothetical protein